MQVQFPVGALPRHLLLLWRLRARLRTPSTRSAASQPNSSVSEHCARHGDEHVERVKDRSGFVGVKSVLMGPFLASNAFMLPARKSLAILAWGHDIVTCTRRSITSFSSVAS